MKPVDGFNTANAFEGGSQFKVLPIGGHICKIVSAKAEDSRNGNEMLVLAFDVAEGSEWDNFYQTQYNDRKAGNPNAKWLGTYRQPTTGRDGQVSHFFEGLIKSIENSNSGYRWNWDERTLIGKKVGFVFGEEEFEKNDGTIGVSVKAFYPRSVESIKNGVDAPERRKLNRATTATSNGGFTEVEDNDLPF